MREPLRLDDATVPVGVSIGIATTDAAVPTPADRAARAARPKLTLETLLHNADTAIYLAKSRRSGYVLHRA